MSSFPFIKASACGNDFLLVELASLPAGMDLAEATRLLCDRHFGVGADGVEWLLPGGEADIRIRLINADGSPAEISGNGTRCVAAHLAAKLGKERIAIQTDAGLRSCTLTSRSGQRFEFETAMGIPQLGGPFSIRLTYGEVTGVPVSMGNPHFVVFVEEFHPGWQAEAAEIGCHQDFRHGVNVELVKVQDRHALSVLFFERGAGETQSSGTGSCAAAAAAIGSGKAVSPVEVRAAGGSQTVRWEDEVFLRGPAQLICEGTFFL
jgi:diaminopimelate epimerase